MPGFALVQAPNYDFSIKSFEPLLPGNSIDEIKKAFPKIQPIKAESSIETFKLMIEQMRYVFPVYIQVKDSKVIDFYARLPQYFLHDLFHQSLITKIGMQDKYKRIDEHAIYVWNKKDLTHTYEGACTITCFPIYYSVYNKSIRFKPLLKSMNSQASKEQKSSPSL